MNGKCVVCSRGQTAAWRVVKCSLCETELHALAGRCSVPVPGKRCGPLLNPWVAVIGAGGTAQNVANNFAAFGLGLRFQNVEIRAGAASNSLDVSR